MPWAFAFAVKAPGRLIAFCIHFLGFFLGMDLFTNVWCCAFRSGWIGRLRGLLGSHDWLFTSTTTHVTYCALIHGYSPVLIGCVIACGCATVVSWCLEQFTS
jgi:hypothetical protein